jgi:hypothetical protein
MSKLKEQTLFSASSIDNKDLFWISKYISGTEGSAGTYSTFRITAGQLRSLLTKQYTSEFTPTTVGIDNVVTHNLNTLCVVVQLYDVGDSFSQIIAEVKPFTTNSVKIVFNQNPIGNVRVVIIGV